jgi:hypothetical protein
VIDVNGSFVATLCVAYFVLIACALSFGQSTTECADAPERLRAAVARGCERGTVNAARSVGPRALAIVAYARSALDPVRCEPRRRATNCRSANARKSAGARTM